MRAEMKMKLVRSVAAVAVLIAASCLLTSCDGNLATGPISIKRSGSEMLIAVCQGVDIRSVSGEFQNANRGVSNRTFLDLSGSARAGKGTIFSTGRDWADLTVKTLRTPDMSNGASMIITINPPDPHGFSGAFTLGAGGLSSSEWMRPDGTLSKSACG
jgi:hypothetical protein